MEKLGNCLITSISKKVPLIKQVRKAAEKIDPQILIYGGDTDPQCIGSYFVDSFWHMPELTALEVGEIVDFCRSHNISTIIPTRDGDLPFFAASRQEVAQQGISVMVSCSEAIGICQDKLRFYSTLASQGYPVIETSEEIKTIKAASYVVKDRIGAGSRHLGLNLSAAEALKHAQLLEMPIFQPFITGTEVSIDVYIDMQGRVKGQVARSRDRVVNGESQITTTFQNEEIERVCVKLAETLKLYGHVVVQLIIDDQNNFHILECNCRFGGASTLSIAAGLDSFYWFFLESKGESLEKYPFAPVDKSIRLVRYPEDLII